MPKYWKEKNNFEVGSDKFLKKLKRIPPYILYWLLALLASCSGSDSTKISDRSYFPLRVGNYLVYQVSETDIEHVTCDDETTPLNNYQLKLLIYDSVKNADGAYTYGIHRYTRPDSTQEWSVLDTWSARITNTDVIINEGNVSYVKFTFPLVNNGQWNGNLYNNLGTEDYSLSALGQPYTLDGEKKFPVTITVVQSDNQDFFVYQDKRIEVYAAAIGLIYKETTQLTYFQDPCYGEQKVKTGLIYKQSLLSYGHE